MASELSQLAAFLKLLKVSDVEKVATVLAACGVDSPDVLADMDTGDREALAVQLNSADISVGDRTKLKRVQQADMESWIQSRTDLSVSVVGPPSAQASVPVPVAAATTPPAAPPPEKFVVKATDALMTPEELWRNNIGQDDVEPLQAAATRTRDELRELVSSTGRQRADLAAAVSLTDGAMKNLHEKHAATAAAIEAKLSGVQAAVEKQLDEVRASVAESVRGRKQALLAEAAAMLTECEAKFGAHRAELSTAETQHAKAVAAGLRALGKGNEEVIGTPKQVAALCPSYSGSLELATHTGFMFWADGADIDGSIVSSTGQITDAVVTFLAPLRVFGEIAQKTLDSAVLPNAVGSGQYGCFFDFVNTSPHALEIMHLETCSNSICAAVTQHLYTRTTEEGTSGAESDPNKWRKVATVVVPTCKTPVHFSLPQHEVIAAGGTRGFCLHSPDNDYAVGCSVLAATDGILRVEPKPVVTSSNMCGSSSGKAAPCGSVTYRYGL